MRLDKHIVWIVRVPDEPRVLSVSPRTDSHRARCRPPFRRSSVRDLDPSLPGSVYNRRVVGVDQ